MQILLPPIPPVHVAFVTQEPYWWARWDFWASFFTFALAIMTGWLAWETRGLRKDSARSIKASEQTAAAAAESAHLARESMQRSLRAYVTLERIDLRELDNLKIPTRINVCFINTGQTPARRLELFYSFTVRDNWPEKDNDPIYGSTLMQADVGKDQRREFYAEYFRSAPQTSDVQTGAKFLMIYGCAKYLDMFSDEPRYTHFSYAWNAKLQTFYPVGTLNSVS